MDTTDITLREAQRLVDRWITTTGGGYFSELTNALILAEETGEVARIVARRFGQQRAKATDDVSPEALADELADVIWVALALANQTGIDLTDALRRNMQKKSTRDATRFTAPAVPTAAADTTASADPGKPQP